jgi:hypothetical protein
VVAGKILDKFVRWCKRVAISSSKGNRQTRPAMTLAETNKNAVAAKSKQKARVVAT